MTWDVRMRNNMFRRLPVEQATGQLYGGRHRLRVVYRTRDLIVLGLGVMIGSGIFKIAGEQATSTAGPAVLLSFLVAGGVCFLAALSYAELSSIVPVAGSAYSFSYVAFGELWAWVVGWALVMELLLAASVLARVWSLYATQTLHDFGVPIPSWLGDLIGQQKGPDLLALGILVLVMAMLATGTRMSLRTLWFMVMAKVIVIGLVIATGLKFFHPGNLTPFVPPSRPRRPAAASRCWTPCSACSATGRRTCSGSGASSPPRRPSRSPTSGSTSSRPRRRRPTTRPARSRAGC
ncbi:APC family permease [Actinomadura yumaensis]|uniref:APC family permease n=1 Tax=Actinomadura yumaensis TaxID=111807 RepID=UPI0036185118